MFFKVIDLKNIFIIFNLHFFISLDKYTLSLKIKRRKREKNGKN